MRALCAYIQAGPFGACLGPYGACVVPQESGKKVNGNEVHVVFSSDLPRIQKPEPDAAATGRMKLGAKVHGNVVHEEFSPDSTGSRKFCQKRLI